MTGLVVAVVLSHSVRSPGLLSTCIVVVTIIHLCYIVADAILYK